MCLAIPGKIVKKENEKGIVDIGGVKKEFILSLVPEAKEGDWVIIHTGFAIQTLSEEDAQETLRLLNELFDIKSV